MHCAIPEGAQNHVFSDVIRNNEKKGLVIGMPEKFNTDTAQVRKDAQMLLEYPIDFAFFGHGAPLLENAQQLNAARGPKEANKNKKTKRK